MFTSLGNDRKGSERRPCRTELVHANHGEAEGGSRAGGEEDDMDAISGEKAKQRRLGSSTGRLDAGSEEGRRGAESWWWRSWTQREEEHPGTAREARSRGTGREPHGEGGGHGDRDRVRRGAVGAGDCRRRRCSPGPVRRCGRARRRTNGPGGGGRRMRARVLEGLLSSSTRATRIWRGGGAVAAWCCRGRRAGSRGRE